MERDQDQALDGPGAERLADLTFPISLFATLHDNAPKERALTWRELTERLRPRPARDKYTFEGGQPVPMLCPTEFAPGATRSKASAERSSLLVLDFDNVQDVWDAELRRNHKVPADPPVTPDEVAAALQAQGLAAVLASTYNHLNPEKHGVPKFRAYLPLARPVPAEAWARWLPAALEAAGLGSCSRGLDEQPLNNPAAMFNVPSHPLSADPVFLELTGSPLDVPVPAPPEPSAPRSVVWELSDHASRGRLPESILDELRSRVDIAVLVGEHGVKLKQAGAEHKGLCPFHEEKTPSFHVNPAKGVFHCFGCGASGDAIAFLQRTTGCDFRAAANHLAARAGLDLSPLEPPPRTRRHHAGEGANPSPAEPRSEEEEELDHLLRRFGYRFDTGRIIDLADDGLVEYKWDSFQHMFPNSAQAWRKHRIRRSFDAGQVVFEPAAYAPEAHLRHEDPEVLNLYRGLPVEADPEAECEGIKALFDWLLSASEPAAQEWVRCWVASLFQHPGRRANSAIVLRSKHQGVGKSLIFERLLRKLMGRYSFKVDNKTLTSDKPWNEWQARRFYIVGEELSCGRSKASELKDWITGETVVIEQRGRDTREEPNLTSWVFLTNDPLPLPLEEADRRFAVLETPPPFGATKDNPGGDPDFYDAVVREVEGRGAAAFLHYLLNYEIPKDFRPHRVPKTRAKERLIHGVRDSVQGFLTEFQAETLDLPYGAAWVKDLYQAYVLYCRENGYKNPTSSPAFGSKLSDHGFTKAKCRIRSKQWWWFLPDDRPTDLDDVEQADRFRSALERALSP